MSFMRWGDNYYISFYLALKVIGDDSVALSGANPSDKGYVYRYYDKKGVAINSTTATNQKTGGGDYMSGRFGGYMDLVANDSTTLMYTYCCYNVNNDDYKKYMGIADGEIVISREALVEPEIHSKLKKMLNGCKRIIEKKS